MNVALSICIYKFVDAQAVQYTSHVMQTHDNNTAMPLVGVLVT